MDSWEMVRTAIAFAALLIACASFFFARRDRSAEANNAALQDVRASLNTRIEALEQIGNQRHNANVLRLTSIEAVSTRTEEAIKSIPNHRDMDVLQNSIAMLGTQVAELKGAQSGTTSMVQQINRFLMEKGT